MRMNKLIYLIIGVILASFVVADTNVDMSIMTDEDLYFNADLNAGGDIDLTIDGMNFDNTVNDLYENDMSMKGVYGWLSRVFMNKDYKNEWFIVNPLKLDVYEQRFRWVMDTYFVPRTEVNQMMSYYNDRITDLELRILALEKVLGDEAVLKGRLNVANELNIDLTYKNTTYINVDNGFITLETVKQPKELTESEIYDLTWGMRDEHGCMLATGYTWCETMKECLKECPTDLLIENWKRLCNSGIRKWCVILEQRGYFPEAEKYEIEVTEGISIGEQI